ncbi:hypothetical protein K6Y31_14355 [Motilimonas cestriensis]|uniref:Uncharacterized protein n=1 Tax=Motilimonas cestriensis TaxID=2742685 RepID=A0ABS8WED8_9GAMM|nr:hypothetical protein [Motilimonas cestriensis]MCE2595991.1 hypothetical protein [Motilimonas cestriensis]
MDIPISEIIAENPITASIFLMVATIGLLVKAITGLINFYEDTYIKRYLKRLNSFDASNIKDEQLCKHLESVKEAEIFFLTSGVRTSSHSIAMLMKIHEMGLIAHHELKRVEPYLRADGEKIRVAVTWVDKCRFIYSLTMSLLMISIGSFIFAYFTISYGLEGALTGVITFSVTAIFSAWVLREFINYRMLQRTTEKLSRLNLLTNPDELIIWSFRNHKKRTKHRMISRLYNMSLEEICQDVKPKLSDKSYALGVVLVLLSIILAIIAIPFLVFLEVEYNTKIVVFLWLAISIPFVIGAISESIKLTYSAIDKYRILKTAAPIFLTLVSIRHSAANLGIK